MQVEDIYFTGALTDPNKTDFFVEYKDEQEKWRRYTPDFVVRLKSGKALIVEVKREDRRGDAIEGERGAKAVALRKWEELDPERLRYEMIFTASDTVAHDEMGTARTFARGESDE